MFRVIIIDDQPIFRDIIDAPERVRESWAKSGMHALLERHYDHVAVYGSKQVYDTVVEYGLPESVVAKPTYVDYVVAHSEPGAEDEPAPEADARPLVVVAVGGGDGGHDTIVEPFLRMLQEHKDEIPFRTEILLGPFFAQGVEQGLRASADGLPVSMKNFVPAPSRLCARSDLVISAAGYNSTSEILEHGKRAILVPRIMHRDEQLIRSKQMAELGLVTFLHPDDVTPQLSQRPGVSSVAASSGDSDSSLRSKPAQNALPAPVRMSTLISGSRLHSCSAATKSLRNSRDKAFIASGRLRVTIAKPSRLSKSTLFTTLSQS